MSCGSFVCIFNCTDASRWVPTKSNIDIEIGARALGLESQHFSVSVISLEENVKEQPLVFST